MILIKLVNCVQLLTIQYNPLLNANHNTIFSHTIVWLACSRNRRTAHTTAKHFTFIDTSIEF